MRYSTRGLLVVAAASFVMVSSGAIWAQTTTSQVVKSFEVISVAGNKLVVREPSGTREYTVPADFRFDIDGKKVPVTALQPGMKGEATFTTTTTSSPVFVTEVREAEVVQSSASSLLVRGPDGFRMYSPGEVEKRGITIMKDGRPVEFDRLHKGDRLTATIVTEGPPKTLTETQVQAVVSSAVPEVATAAAPITAASPTAAAAPTTAAPPTTAAAPTDAVSTPAPVTQPAAESASGFSVPLMIGLFIAFAALVWFLLKRRQGST